MLDKTGIGIGIGRPFCDLKLSLVLLKRSIVVQNVNSGAAAGSLAGQMAERGANHFIEKEVPSPLSKLSIVNLSVISGPLRHGLNRRPQKESSS